MAGVLQVPGPAEQPAAAEDIETTPEQVAAIAREVAREVVLEERERVLPQGIVHNEAIEALTGAMTRLHERLEALEKRDT
jgi:hypothetical protein